MLLLIRKDWNFPGGQASTAGDTGLIPGRGSKILQAVQCDQTNKSSLKKKKKDHPSKGTVVMKLMRWFNGWANRFRFISGKQGPRGSCTSVTISSVLVHTLVHTLQRVPDLSASFMRH